MFLRGDDRVVGVLQEGIAKAYPLRILNWHEVVDDVVGTTPIAVTYCPLTGTAVVYDRRAGGRTATFGVSGRLYQSNVLLYDHETDSLWSQLLAQAVAGAATGTPLHALPAVVTTWSDWQRTHPDTRVLSIDTGYPRDYSRDPYAGYRTSSALMFPVRHSDSRLPAKELIFGLQSGDQAKAYPLAQLATARQVDDHIGSTRVRITYDPAAARASAVMLPSQQPLAGIVGYWFAWAAFHPNTALWGNTPPSERATRP
jgi:hypothetical protein